MILMYGQELPQLPLFEGLSPAQMALVAPLLKLRDFHAGQLIFRQGQVALHFFILIQGQVIIRYKPYDAPPIDVAHIEPGGVFGWSAALRRAHYTSSATALAAGRALMMQGADLEKLCEKSPDTGKLVLNRMADVIAEGLRTLHSQVILLLTEGMSTTRKCEKER